MSAAIFSGVISSSSALQRSALQISARSCTPMMTTSFPRSAYVRRRWGMTIRPWLSGTHFTALAKRERMALDLLTGREANLAVKRSQLSWG